MQLTVQQLMWIQAKEVATGNTPAASLNQVEPIWGHNLFSNPFNLNQSRK